MTRRTKTPAVYGFDAIGKALERLEAQRRPASTSRPDNLKRIRGIGVLMEKRLNDLGIMTYAQIAAWGPDDIDRVNAALELKGRIIREHWVEQAKILATGHHTAYSRHVDSNP